LRGLALNFASTQQTENAQGFSEIGQNKQLFIAIVCPVWVSLVLAKGKILI
jgi:hypothetical protein